MNTTLSHFHHSMLNKYFICFLLFLLSTGFVLEQAHATANYVYHERSTNNPGCGGQFVSNLTPGSADAVTLRFKVEYQYYTDNARLYYTTDGTNPSGAYGTPSGTTQVVTANWVCLFNAGQNVDVWEAAIPAQQGGKTVKYIISAWHSGGGSEIFANSGEFVSPKTTSAQATQFSYTVTCPTITVSPTSLSSGTVGSSYNQSVTASGGTSSYTYAVTTGTLPAGLMLASNGTLSGTPTTSGTSNFTITATDANGCTGSQSYSLTVACPTITVNPSTLPSGTAGLSYSHTITASGGTSPYTFAVSTGTLPSGLGLSSGGVLSGTPSGAGTSNFTVLATDANGCTGSFAYTLTVSVTCDTGVVLDQQQTETANGSSAIQSGYENAQTFTPSQTGVLKQVSLSLTKQDGYDYTNSQPVGPGNLIIELQTTTSTTANSFGGNCGTLTRLVPSGTVLASLTILESATLTGVYTFPSPVVVTSGQQYAIVLRNTGVQPADGSPGRYDWNQGRGSGSSDLYTGGSAFAKPINSSTWNISEAVQPNSCNFTIYDDYGFGTYIGLGITLSPGSLSNGTVGTAYSQTITASNGASPYTFAVTSGSLPAGLTLSNSGELSGTPTVAATSNFTVTATDANGCTGSQSYSITVACPTITVNPSTLPSGVAGSSYSETITASGGASPYTFAVSTGSIPVGLTLSTGGVLSGTPSTIGTSNFSVMATDANGCTGVGTFTINVVDSCAQTLDQQQTEDGGGSYSGIQSGYKLAQTFTPSQTGKLKKFELKLDNQGGGDLIVELQSTVSGSAPSFGGSCGNLTRNLPTGTVLATMTIPSSSIPASPSQFYQFEFPTPATLTGGMTYAFVLYQNGGGYYRWFQMGGSSTDSYTGGLAFTLQDGNPTWNINEAVQPNSCNFTAYRDMTFKTYVGGCSPPPCPTITVTPSTLPNGTTGSTYSQNIVANGGAVPYSFAVTGGALPSGLTLSTAGSLSGTPSTAGESNFTVTATDSNGCTGIQSYTLIIQDGRTGSISGKKWNDTNGNGVKDREEQGIQNWNIYLTGAKIDSTLTDANGNYSFNGLSAGEYTVREETREGWTQTYPESVTHIVVLTAGEDANQKNFGNKVTEETTPPFTYTTPEILDGQDEFCTPLIMNRNYTASETWFVKAKGGDLGVTLYAHAVNNVDPESVFVQVFNSSSTLVTEFGVGYTAGEVSSAGIGFEKSIMVNLGGRTPGEILRFVVTTPSPTPATQPHYRFHFGRVVSAALNSPSFPGFEEEYARWYVNVLPSENLNLDFFTTDMPTPADTMVVRVVDPSGAYHAASGMYPVDATTEINVPGASSGVWSVEVEHINGHYRMNKTTGTDRGIYVGQFSGGCGEKIVNLTQNGSPASGLPVGITINRQVATPSGLQYVPRDSAFTDSSSFRFDKLPSGFYKIDVRPMSPGYTTPAAQYDTVMCDSVLVNTFNFNSNTGRITGMKFEDTNGNGVKDENEHGIPNWEIFLNGEAFMASTDTNGHYEFNNLVAGTYIVSEVSAEGWIQTFPGDPGTYTVELTPGATVSGKNFGNKRDCSIACAPDTTLYMPSNGCTVSGVTLTPPSIDGICEIISSTNNAPTDFSLGTTTVEWTVTVAGGAVYTCNQVVTVLDTIKPTVVCSPNLNVSADENQCGANVNFTFGATDNCPGVMTTASHTSGSFFGLGTTTVTVIAADSAGNSDTCSFTVTVTDTHPPVVICPANMNVYATSEAGAVVNFSVSGTDNCPGVMTSTNPPSGSLFPLGATTVISIATDSSGNADTCSFTINVLAEPAMISGMKYEDADGDGVKDVGEAGLQGWVISLTGSATALDTTDGSGNYSFTNLAAGTYTVREVVKSGWVQTTANPADITLAMGDTVTGVNFGNFHLPVISGMKFNDLNGNGVKDNGESGLANWIIKAVKGVTTKFDTTDANGEYSFSFTIAQLGTWVISEELQSGWAQTFPAGGTYSIALASGTNSTNTDFGNQQFSSISGSKYDDFDGDSVTSGDAKLSGWVIKLFKNNAIVSRTTTNGSGDYTFTNLTPGTYVVQESLRVGWIQTYPSVSNSVPAVDDVNEGPRAYSVTITSGSVITGKDFANFKLGTLSGVKFLDYNGDSLKNAGELGLENWEIVLTKDATAYDTAYTDASGNYQFTNLLAADYTVSETGREGWYQTTPASGSYIITVSSGTTETSLNFGNFEYGSISGVKFFDRDSSGTKDPTCETILPGTKIVLVGPHATADTLTTDANGEFTFTNVPAGVFTLKEGNNPNWNQTYPANGASYSITMVSGLDSTGLTFGNFYMPDTSKFRTFILSDYAKSSRAVKKSGFISNPTAGNVRDTVFINRGFGLDNQNDSGYLRIGIRRPDSSLVYGWFFHRWSIYKGPAVKHWIYNTKAWGLKRNPKTKTYVQRNPAFYLGIVGEQITETYFGNAGNHLTMELTTLKTNIAASDLGITPRGLGDLLFVCRDNTADSVFNGMTVRKIVSIADTMLTMGRKIVNVSASQIDTTYRCDVPYLALLDSTLARINNEFRSTATKIDTISTKPLKLKGVKGLYKVSYLMRDSIAPIPLAHFDPVYASSTGEPEEFKLEQNYPNPFNPTTTLSFVISNQSLVTLKIYNLLGQEVATLFDKQDMEAGMQEVEFNGANLASGVYFYRLTATSAETGTVNTDVKRMIMIK